MPTKDEIVGEIVDTPGVHGAVIASDGHIFTSNGRENKASMVDARSLQTIKKVDTEGNPDFIGAHNSKMLMMDSTNGKVVAEVPIGAGVDATWFDPGTGYAFSSCSTGTVTVAHEDALDKLTVVQTLQTATGARTMALDPATHRIYLAAAKYTPPPEGSPANARPTLIPGSMHLLVYGIDGK